MEKRLVLLFTVLFRSCLAALRCGNCGQTPVPYPLSTGPNCGDQSYKVRCNQGQLWFDALKGASYMINSINPQSQKLILRPPPLIPATCLSSDSPSEGLQLDQNLPFNVSSTNTILLLNCSDNMLHLQSPINCSSTCICHDYINNTPSAKACNEIKLCCAFRTGGSQTEYTLSVHSNGCLAYQSYVNLDYSLPFKKWPQPGLELMWVAPQEPGCISAVDCRVLPFSSCLADPRNAGKRRCFCKSGRYWNPSSGECRKCKHGSPCKIRKKKMPVIAATVGTFSLVAISGFLIYYRHIHSKKEAHKQIIKEREQILNTNTNNSGKSAKVFSGKDIKKATNNFSQENLLGTGGFGEVFMGTLDDETHIAVKRAKHGSTKGTLQLLNEVRILSMVNHRSLVKLLGCCVELDQPLLIYEYVSNGTLFDHLHRKGSPLTWFQRVKIAYQTSDGLAYLHSSAEPPIYHRDIKSSNILLDDKLDAKVSDFGLSRLVELNERNNTCINTSAQGTLGYLDPEYYLNLKLTDKSDVYSFGVVLLELLTSKRAIDFNREESNVNLVVYMKKIMDEEKLMDVIDPFVKDGASEAEIDTMIAIGNLAAACLDERRQNRPSMKEVADEIEYILGIVSGKASKS